MLFRMLQIGCVVIVAFVGRSAQSVQAQYPFGGQSCTNGNGYQGQSFYGPQNGYSPQPPFGYGGGYAMPGFNVNQSFYPSGLGYNTPAPIQHNPSHHSHHAWHPGHYLFGHH